MNGSLKKYILKTNQLYFDTLVRFINFQSNKDYDVVLARIQRAVRFAVQNDTGCFALLK